jgi:hypothetical protein
MKKKLLLTVLTFLIFESVKSQSCLPKGITFSTQAQIDNFSINYPGCTDIEGYVCILGSDITNLNGLSSLSSVEGGLYIYDNPILSSFIGLDNLSSVGENLIITENSNLTSLSGLDNLTSVGGELGIDFNLALTSLSGLDNLSSVEGDLYVYDNSVLTSLSGLENLRSVGGDLTIVNNESLTSLTGLDNFNYSTITGLAIHKCPNLSICEVKSVCDYLDNRGTATITKNAPGCNSVDEVEAACMAVPVEEVLPNGVIEIQVFPNPTNDIL